MSSTEIITPGPDDGPKPVATQNLFRAPAAAHMGFIGVSTSSSSIMRVFPAWADILGLPTRHLVGHDLPLDANRTDYRALVKQLRDDPTNRGALVTTHKLGVFAAASDLFDELDEFAGLCGEISSISKRDRLLIGHAKDPVTVGLSLEEFLPANIFATAESESRATATGRAEVVCLGAGGAGIAASWYLGRRDVRPARIVCTDTDQGRLDHLQQVHQSGLLDNELFTYVRVSTPQESDGLVASAPPGSLIINATGLGKDRAGSPLSDLVQFPERALAWDMNYRGDLVFLTQARAQQKTRNLTVVDGWRYFIHGWTQVIAEVFDLELTPELVEELAVAAQDMR